MNGGEALDRAALERAATAMFAEEAASYAAVRPVGRDCGAATGPGFLDGVPLHWMRDWPMPFPLVLAAAEGARLEDIDGHVLTDFCLGDTGAMFGHAPAPVVAALARSATAGFTTMLPSPAAARVGRLLSQRFGLPHWQVATTASDANRFAIRVARAVTGRPKILVFEGCYHGAVDDTLVDRAPDGATLTRASLLGQVVDLATTTTVVPFNDEAALAMALAGGDIACVLAEPVMTNCSMIAPQPGFHAALRRLTRDAGTLLLIDETHTISSGLGGYTALHGLEPDLFVVGKAIAGGIPASVWGLSAAVAERLAAVRAVVPGGHSGIGTTLSGSTLQLACLEACLTEVMTAEAYAAMNAGADVIEAGLAAALRRHALPWHVARVGARLELVLRAAPLVDAADARAAASHAIEAALHLALLNRGFLLTPFHNMMLVSPAASIADCERLVAAFDAVLGTLVAAAA
ncbi:transaminase [Methylobrevis albus]|uniref:Aminotransferase class III-fold pyridoxal phosphate-dependent enzyme n=1 Tax=Methylobrevis albus TaxID=2793297 RepID=A0A931MYB8_9HYPH|nr:transaminase [Methylobrevis albus]MBH0237835.1 aminotransferase class III-fold pyridoxal phosphate-dependent enzyme [Methylobrevis albus]